MNQFILIFIAAISFCSFRSYALEIKENGEILFSFNAQFYSTKRSTVVKALTDPRPSTIQKSKLVTRILNDVNCPDALKLAVVDGGVLENPEVAQMVVTQLAALDSILLSNKSQIFSLVKAAVQVMEINTDGKIAPSFLGLPQSTGQSNYDNNEFYFDDIRVALADFLTSVVVSNRHNWKVNWPNLDKLIGEKVLGYAERNRTLIWYIKLEIMKQLVQVLKDITKYGTLNITEKAIIWQRLVKVLTVSVEKAKKSKSFDSYSKLLEEAKEIAGSFSVDSPTEGVSANDKEDQPLIDLARDVDPENQVLAQQTDAESVARDFLATFESPKVKVAIDILELDESALRLETIAVLAAVAEKMPEYRERIAKLLFARLPLSLAPYLNPLIMTPEVLAALPMCERAAVDVIEKS